MKPIRRVLVCGSRNWPHPKALDIRIFWLRYNEGVDPKDCTILHGGAGGADVFAGALARKLGHPVEVFPANWALYGRAAGAIRNREMLDTNPDLVIAFCLNESRGTMDTVREARRRGIPTEVYTDPEGIDREMPKVMHRWAPQ